MLRADPCAEVVILEELDGLLERSGPKRAYIGFEPSGLAHVGWLIAVEKVKQLQACGFDVTILLADWHAYINDKLGGDLQRIRRCGAYMEQCFLGLGVDRHTTRFVYASDYIGDAAYWELVIKVGKAASLTRIKRALTIMGRSEDEADLDSSKMLYPLMQVADIFFLQADIALGGMDQRKAHMLMRDVAPKLGRTPAVAIHTPLLCSLKGGASRMDPLEAKMSKSDPSSALYLHDTPQALRDKLAKAYCPAKEVEGNPLLQLARFVLFSRPSAALSISRPPKFGGDVTFASYADLERAFVGGALHPSDLKSAVAQALADHLAPVREHLGEHRALLDEVASFAATR